MRVNVIRQLVGVGALMAAVACSGGRQVPVATAPPPAPPAAPASPAAPAQPGPTAAATGFEPVVGQAGKDVVWVPSSPELIEKMLDLAKLTPNDYVIDLGSGDGRNIIAAAKRGARGHGVEYNADMVALSRKLAQEAGVAERATFIQGDMYEADITRATVMALFLLPVNLDKLQDKFLALPPGTRLVLNTFLVTGWQPDVSERLETNCNSWCTAHLYIVPAKVAGQWRIDGLGDLTLSQQYQTVTGTLAGSASTAPAVTGRLRGSDITLEIGGATYSGRVDGTRITGTTPRAWSATRIPG